MLLIASVLHNFHGMYILAQRLEHHRVLIARTQLTIEIPVGIPSQIVRSNTITLTRKRASHACIYIVVHI